MLLATLLVAMPTLGCVGAESPATPSALEMPAPEVSFLALGDTGMPPHWTRLLDGQLAVARALAAEDRRRPADALVLLGDNFYPDGLRSRRLTEQIRANLVRPYCRFLDLSGPRSDAVEQACGLPRSSSRPIPLLAVLGNHDYDARERARSSSARSSLSTWRTGVCRAASPRSSSWGTA